MILFIAGASHAGKTALAQKLMEEHRVPYLSIDHLKMGLIRSGNTSLTPCSDDGDLTEYLWPIVREIVKTAIENEQHLIVEGCYIPFDWARDFEPSYLSHIRYFCLIFSEDYIQNHFDDIRRFANRIEKRLEDSCDKEQLLVENRTNLALAQQYNLDYLLIQDSYEADLNGFLKEREYDLF